jgi:hypothetical protein
MQDLLVNRTKFLQTGQIITAFCGTLNRKERQKATSVTFSCTILFLNRRRQHMASAETAMTKEQLLAKIRTARTRWEDLLAKVPATRMTQPGVASWPLYHS